MHIGHDESCADASDPVVPAADFNIRLEPHAVSHVSLSQWSACRRGDPCRTGHLEMAIIDINTEQSKHGVNSAKH
jgi:inosine-uridine nucleoside N-ribohydrolase